MFQKYSGYEQSCAVNFYICALKRLKLSVFIKGLRLP